VRSMSSLDDQLLAGERIVYRSRSHWILFGAPILVALAGIALGITLQLTAHDYWLRRCRAGRRRADPGAPADAALPQLRLRRDRQACPCAQGAGASGFTGDAAEQDRGDRRGANLWDGSLGMERSRSPAPAAHTSRWRCIPRPSSSGARCRARSSPSTSAVAGSRRPPALRPTRASSATAPGVRSESWRGLACASTAGVPSSRSELPSASLCPPGTPLQSVRATLPSV